MTDTYTHPDGLAITHIDFMGDKYTVRPWDATDDGLAGPHGDRAHYGIVTSPAGNDYLVEYNGDTYSVLIVPGGPWSNARQAHDAPGDPQYVWDLTHRSRVGQAISNWEAHGIVQG